MPWGAREHVGVFFSIYYVLCLSARALWSPILAEGGYQNLIKGEGKFSFNNHNKNIKMFDLYNFDFNLHEYYS